MLNMDKKTFDERLETRIKSYRGMPLTETIMNSVLAEVWEELNCILVEKGTQPLLYSEFKEYF